MWGSVGYCEVHCGVQQGTLGGYWEVTTWVLYSTASTGQNWGGTVLVVPHSTPKYPAVPRSTLKYLPVPCSTLQYPVVPCSTLQCPAVLLSTPQYPPGPPNTLRIGVQGVQSVMHATLQYRSVPCNNLQYLPVPCLTP